MTQEHQDHIVQHPYRFKQTQVAPGVVDLVPTWQENPSEIIQLGTPIDRQLFNGITSQLAEMTQPSFNRYAEDMAAGGSVLIECWGDSTYAHDTAISTFRTAIRSYFKNDLIQVVNKGLSGDGTGNRLKTWAADMAASSAQIIYMNYCINDAKGSANASLNPKIDGETYRENLREMIHIARAAGKIVILDTPNPAGHNNSIGPSVPENVKQFANIMRQVALELNILYVDQHETLEKWISKPRNRIQDLLPDGYHPGDVGYRQKGLNMLSVFAHPQAPRVDVPMIIPAVGPAVRAFGTNERATAATGSRVGYGKLVDGQNASIRIPIFIDKPGMDLYLATPLWVSGTTSAEIFVDTISIGTIDLYDSVLNFALDKEVMIVENVNPGFHLIEIKNTQSTGSVGAYYLRTLQTRKSDFLTGTTSGGNPSVIGRNLVLQDIEMTPAAASSSTVLLTDVPTSRFLKTLDIEITATLGNAHGLILFGHQTSQGKPHGGLFMFLENNTGILRVSEGSGTTGFIGATNIGNTDLRGQRNVYRITVTTAGLCTFFVNDTQVGTYTLTRAYHGGFFGLFSQGVNGKVRIEKVLIN